MASVEDIWNQEIGRRMTSSSLSLHHYISDRSDILCNLTANIVKIDLETISTYKKKHG